MSGRVQKVLGEALDAEIESRARRALSDPDGGEDWSASRAEIESKLHQP